MFGFNRKKKKKGLTPATSIFSRISGLLQANVHVALDQAEDLEKMLDQFVRDFATNIPVGEPHP